jgi:hypothetical protein
MLVEVEQDNALIGKFKLGLSGLLELGLEFEEEEGKPVCIMMTGPTELDFFLEDNMLSAVFIWFGLSWWFAFCIFFVEIDIIFWLDFGLGIGSQTHKSFLSFVTCEFSLFSFTCYL